MIGYGFTKELDLPFEKVRERVTEELQREGFGIMTEIDVREKFREKLGIDFPRYLILGACHPPSALKSILAEENIGLMLPCNVLVFEKGRKTVLSVVKPTAAMQMIDNPVLAEVAAHVEGRLKKVFDAVS